MMTNDTFEEWFEAYRKSTWIVKEPMPAEYYLWAKDDMKIGWQASRSQPQEAVAVLIADPMFLPALNVPLMDWKVDVTNLPIGTELYTSQPNEKAEIARLRELLQGVVESLRGYRLAIDDTQPCDAEKLARAALAMKGE